MEGVCACMCPQGLSSGPGKENFGHSLLKEEIGSCHGWDIELAFYGNTLVRAECVVADGSLEN